MTSIPQLLRLFVLVLIANGVTSQTSWAIAGSVDDLLDMVREGRVVEAKENRKREARFLNNKSQQKRLYQQAVKERNRLEKISVELEKKYDKNADSVITLQNRLNGRMGTLKDLFSHLQTSSGSSAVQIDNSIISAQYPNRSAPLTSLSETIANSATLPSIKEIENLWYELQREIIESGKVTRFKADVINTDGIENKQEVIRVGAFNLVSGGNYLQYIPETKKIIEYAKQPPSHFSLSALSLAKSEDDLSSFGIDPTRGAILDALVQTPELYERIEQGGIVGYIILGLGALGLLLVFERLAYLALTSRRISAQVNNKTPDEKNPLGRIFKIYQDNKTVSTDTLELKLGEAILKERAPLERFLTFLKIISVVSPLLGLLGTVTGMINTFQAITLFGTGDPQLMAGGISQALITTVMGLSIAIPIVLLHTIVSSRSKRLLMILEEQSAGMIAEQAEQGQP
ncbi:hypothetical protein A9Q99_01230 [Gammaproteobacteria bacterium 45_16_T64]|nr:hypothetical protein A9Q99_01230 [Gammaproteobacteria bacterium 45_16_T64]